MAVAKTKPIEFKATLKKVCWAADGEGSRFLIATCEGPSGDVSVKGETDPKNLIQGVEYVFIGKWGKAKPPYGIPFEFSTVVQGKPHSRTAVIQYLVRYASGIGPVYAAQLWDAYGSDAVRIMRSDVARVVREIGVPQSKASKASESLNEFMETENTRIDLTGLLDGRGFPRSLIETLISKWGVNATERVKRDPFTLLINRLPGCGFARCDTLYNDLGLPLDRLKRQFACIWKSLREDSEGSTWHPISLAKMAVEQSISGIDREKINWQRAVKLGVRSKWLAYRKDESGNQWIAERSYADNESTVASHVVRLMSGVSNSKAKWPRAADIEGLKFHQRDQISIATSGRIGILTGDPGTGKTTAAAMLIKQLLRNGKLNIAVASPTNMAAQRIRIELESHGIADQVFVSTFHRLLGTTRGGQDGGGWGFYYTEKNQLPFDVIVIDEDSMRGIEISASLLPAIKTGTLVLLLGDCNQLPPVGAGSGAPLRDFIASGIPRGHLTEVLRNSGAIREFCESCRGGTLIKAPKKIDIQDGYNHSHFECSSPVMQKRMLVEKITKLSSVVIDGSPIDPIRESQVIVAVNEKGEVSRKEINKLVREILNPHGERAEHNPFRVGDKIICQENCNLPGIRDLDMINDRKKHGVSTGGDDEDPERIPVVNGEFGIVVQVTSKFSKIRLESTGNHIVIPVFRNESEGNGNFDLAYAVTFHKSQGSQWKVVFLLSDRAANRMGSRELWNTGGSRPRMLLVTIGELSTIQRQCSRSSLAERKTFLVEKIRAELAK